MAISLLILFNFIFFYTLWTRPFQMSTSELLSTFYPTWRNQGKRDDYWLRPNCHPVLSTYYPPQILSSLIGRHLSLDASFVVLLWSLLLHTLFGSVGAFIALDRAFQSPVAIFGAITFAYQAFHLRQQPCLIYTVAWFPWIAICPGLAIGMMLLAGYYPYAIYLLPMGLFLCHDPFQWVIGLAIGAIQIVPFLRYLPKTIRKPYGEGSLGAWERKYYFGITPIIVLVLTFKLIYLSILLPILGSYILRKWLPRGYQRAWIISCYLAIYFSLVALSSLDRLQMTLLILVQAADLWLHNRELLPPRPFCELPKKPSLAFNTKLTRFLKDNLDKDARVSGLPWPLFTGHINGFRTLGYCGSMQLKLMAKWRGDTDPNGSGNHDYFMGKEDGNGIDIARVQYAYSRKKLDWPRVPGFSKLYINPRYNLQGR